MYFPCFLFEPWTIHIRDSDNLFMTHVGIIATVATGAPTAFQAKLIEIATVLERSDLEKFLDLFPSSFQIRGLLNSEAEEDLFAKMPKSAGLELE